jgi:hypothetical protein
MTAAMAPSTLSNSSNLCISSLRLINGFFNTPLWLLKDLRRTEQSVRQSVLLVREKYEADKVDIFLPVVTHFESSLSHLLLS